MTEPLRQPGPHPGCFSRPRKFGYWADDRRNDASTVDRIWIENRMSRECVYRHTTQDERCEGCATP